MSFKSVWLRILGFVGLLSLLLLLLWNLGISTSYAAPLPGFSSSTLAAFAQSDRSNQLGLKSEISSQSSNKWASNKGRLTSR